MREFACRSIGNECSWKHSARTEDLLADVAALHLREVHGMPALGEEMVARIKQTFSEPSVEPMDDDRLTLKEFRCNIGQDCSWHYIAQTEELIVDGVALHARETHGIREFTQEMKVKVENSLRPWNG